MIIYSFVERILFTDNARFGELNLWESDRCDWGPLPGMSVYGEWEQANLHPNSFHKLSPQKILQSN